MSNSEENTATLVNLGLTGVQAKIYLALLCTGPAAIKEIASASKVARPDIYRAINELQQAGIVEKIVVAPAKFKPLPIIDAIEVLMLKRTKESIELNKKTMNLIENLKEKMNKKTFSEDNQYILIPSEAIELEVSKLLENSKYNLSFMISSKNLFQWLDKYYELFQNALKRKVSIRIITEKFADSNKLKAIQDLEKFSNFEHRFAVGPLTVWLRIFNDTKILLTNSTLPEQTDFAAVFSNNPHLAELAQNYFKASWFSAIEPQDLAFKYNRLQVDYLFANLTIGFSYYKLIFDQEGNPIDMVILATNKAFIELSGLKVKILGEKASKILPDMSQKLSGLIDKYWTILSNGKSVNFEYYSQDIKKWFSVIVYSPEKGYLAALAEDISEHKKTEHEVFEQRDRAELYLNIVNSIILALDFQGKITLLNRKGYKTLGYKEGELDGKDWFETCLPVHLRKELRLLHQRLVQGNIEMPEYKENPLVTKNGEQKIIKWYNSVLRNDTGQILGTLSSGEDITESKKTEAALRTSEEHYRQLFCSMTEMFQVIELIHDSKGKAIDYYYREVNPAFEKLVNMSKEKLVGKRAKELFSIVEDYWLETYDRVAKTGLSAKFENYGAELDKYYWVNVWKLMEKENHVAIMFSDTTERRKAEDELKNSEKKFRSLFENCLDGMIVAKRDGKIISANPAICEMLGMTEKEVFAAGRQGIVVNDKRNIAALKEQDNKGKVVSQIAFRRKDNSVFEAEISSRNFLDIDGSTIILVTIREIARRCL